MIATAALLAAGFAVTSAAVAAAPGSTAHGLAVPAGLRESHEPGGPSASPYHRDLLILALAIILGQTLCLLAWWMHSRRRQHAERRGAVQVLRESLMRYARATAASGVGVWDWDLATDTIHVDHGFETLLGLCADRRGQVLDWRALIHPDDVLDVMRRVEACRRGTATGFETELRMRHQDGTVRWFFVRGIVEGDGRGQPVRIIGTHTDVTERRLSAEAARESEQRFQHLADIAPVLIWIAGPDKLCTYFNKTWLDFTGRRHEDEVGQGWMDTLHPDDRLAMISGFCQAFEARQPFMMEYRRRRRDGQYRWMMSHGVPRFTSGEGFLGYIGCCLDITDRKNDEAELQQSRQELVHLSRVSSLGALSTALAHELNQPLGAILSNAQAALRFIRQNPPNLQEVTEILEDVVSADQRAGEIIQRMRLMLKRGQPQYLPLDLNQLANEVVWLMRSELMHRQTTVELALAHDLAPVLGDRVPLQQVLMNLIFNASDAMQHLPSAERRLLVRTSRLQNTEAGVEVSDEGVGLRPEDVRRLFTPFFTTKKQGLGVGLAISKSIMDAHGGRIWAENNPDRGATFHLELPFAPLAPPARGADPAGSRFSEGEPAAAVAAGEAAPPGARRVSVFP